MTPTSRMEPPERIEVSLPGRSEESCLKPLVVDLDGTLAASDTLLDQVLRLALTRPITLLGVALRSHSVLDFKRGIAQKCEVSSNDLLFNSNVLETISDARFEKRPLILATGSLSSTANVAAAKFGRFDLVIASDQENLSGTKKRDQLVSQFGASGFDYVGNSVKDLSIWRVSDDAFVVGSKFKARILSSLSNREITPVSPRRVSPKALIRSMRPTHWSKNGLVFLAPMLAFSMDLQTALQLAFIFVSLSLVASGTYIINDIGDVEGDRRHKSKSARPLAAGEVSVSQLALLSLVLISLAGVTSFLSSGPLGLLWTLGYFVSSLIYSLRIKKFPVYDVIWLSLLYIFRIVVGAQVAAVSLSFWLIVFAGAAFLSLALVKRSVELSNVESDENLALTRRGYIQMDMQWVNAIGIGSGLSSMLLLALYFEDRGLLSGFQVAASLLIIGLWSIWIIRIWMLVARKQMEYDPVRHALSNRESRFILVILFATYLLLAQNWGGL